MNFYESQQNIRPFAPAIIDLARIEGVPPATFLQNSKGTPWTAEQKKAAYKNLNILDGNGWKKMRDFQGERKTLLAQWHRYPAVSEPSGLNAMVEAIISSVKIIFSLAHLTFSVICNFISQKISRKTLDIPPVFYVCSHGDEFEELTSS